MAGTLKKLALFTAIFASFIGYLARLPNSDDLPQSGRVRAIAGIMKLNHLIGLAAETVGVSDRIQVIRRMGIVMNAIKQADEDEGVTIKNTKIEGVRVRIVQPIDAAGILPAIVYYHGGAYYMGSPDTHNALTSALARLAKVVVISVDYRLAPEHPFPAGLEDCYKVTKYILENGNKAQLNIDQNRVAIAGDSAGGNFAAVLAMRFATNPNTKNVPRAQILIYPVLQMFDMMLPSYMTEHAQVFLYSVDHTLSAYFNQNIDSSIYANNHTTAAQKKQYRKYVDWNLIPAKYRKVYNKPINDDLEGDPVLVERAKLTLNPEVSPLLVEDQKLAKLFPTYVLTVGHDRLRDESFIYAARLKKNGVRVVHNHYEHTFHAAINFLHGPLALDVANDMVVGIVKFVQDTL